MSQCAYEWATVRLVPRVHREEFLNVGVLLHARVEEVLAVRLDPDWERLRAVAPQLDRATVERALLALDRINRAVRGATDRGQRV